MKWTRRKAIVGGIVAGGVLGVGFWFARERDRLGSRTLFNVGADEEVVSVARVAEQGEDE